MNIYEAFKQLLAKPVFSDTLHAPAGVLGVLVHCLEEMEQNGGRSLCRYRFYYGDRESGKSYGYAAEGYVVATWYADDDTNQRRQCFGILPRVNSAEVELLYWEGVVKVEGTRTKMVFYEHPRFHVPKPEKLPSPARVHRKVLLRRDHNHAR